MLQLEGIAKQYEGADEAAVTGITMTVCPKEIWTITGPSGCGKSTLLNVMGLLTEPTEGTYLVDSVDAVAADYATKCQLRSSMVSTIFQKGNLFPHLTAMENILVGMMLPDEKLAEEALSEVGLAEKRGSLSGLLSGGEQSRVAIARALARRTPFLLADEPTASLDPTNTETVLRLLQHAASTGVGVVVVSHDERVTSIATDRMRLERGVRL